MIFRCFATIAVAIAVAAFARPAQATIIIDVIAGANTATQTYGAVSFNTVNAGNGNAPGSSANTLVINAAVESGYLNGTPFNWTIEFVDSDVDPNINGWTKYDVTVNLTNNRLHPISPVTFTLSDPTETVNLFGSTAAGPNNFDSTFNDPTPVSTYNTVNFNGDLTGTETLQFGGFSGGGGEFYTGQTATFNFSLDLADYVVAGNNGVVAGNFMLTMVANPEPASLALAGLAISGGGAGFIARRRRKKASQAEAVLQAT